MERHTISEASERLKLTRQGLRLKIKKLGIQTMREGNKTYLSQEQLEELQSSINGNSGNLGKGNSGNINGNLGNNHETLKFLQEALDQERERSQELQKALDQEQHLHAGTMKQLNDAREQMKLIEHQPSEELNGMIALLERTRDSFLQNMKTLNRTESIPLANNLSEAVQHSY